MTRNLYPRKCSLGITIAHLRFCVVRDVTLCAPECELRFCTCRRSGADGPLWRSRALAPHLILVAKNSPANVDAILGYAIHLTIVVPSQCTPCCAFVCLMHILSEHRSESRRSGNEETAALRDVAHASRCHWQSLISRSSTSEGCPSILRL